MDAAERIQSVTKDVRGAEVDYEDGTKLNDIINHFNICLKTLAEPLIGKGVCITIPTLVLNLQ